MGIRGKRKRKVKRECCPTRPLRKMTVAELGRFTRKIKVAGVSGGCWEWTGAVCKKSGYARFKMDGACVRAHRVAFRHYVGKIPDDKDVHHECHNRVCVNPEHLDTWDITDNRSEGAYRGALLRYGQGDVAGACTRCGGTCVERQRGKRCLNCNHLHPRKTILPEIESAVDDAVFASMGYA